MCGLCPSSSNYSSTTTCCRILAGVTIRWSRCFAAWGSWSTWRKSVGSKKFTSQCGWRFDQCRAMAPCSLTFHVGTPRHCASLPAINICCYNLVLSLHVWIILRATTSWGSQSLQTHRSIRRLSTVGLPDHTEDNVDLCSDPTARLRAPLMTDHTNLLLWFDQQNFCDVCATDRDMIFDEDSCQVRHAHFAGGPDYTEDNTGLCSGRHNLPGGMSVQESMFSMPNAADADPSCPLMCLHQAMKQLCTKNWTGLNTDFSQLCVQHPAARCALEVQQGYSLSHNRLCVFILMVLAKVWMQHGHLLL